VVLREVEEGVVWPGCLLPVMYELTRWWSSEPRVIVGTVDLREEGGLSARVTLSVGNCLFWEGRAVTIEK